MYKKLFFPAQTTPVSILRITASAAIPHGRYIREGKNRYQVPFDQPKTA
jgi:hypothetical protein